MQAQLPLNELLRIKALHDLAILDSPREQSFDDVAQVAMQLCDVPIAVVSLVDEGRQWFKSCLGLDGSETPRDIAFCAHAILCPDDVTLVEDATKDPRFSDNILVVGEPYIRFYAGAPLVTDEGFALGTLCVVDYKPRSLNDGQITALKALARQIMQLIRLKTTHDAMQQYSTRLQTIADKVPVLIGEINLQQRYTFNNKRYHEWFGEIGSNFLGKTPNNIFPAESIKLIQSALFTSFSGQNATVEITLHNGVSVEMNYLPNIQNNKVVGVFEVGTDVTERKFQSRALQRERERLEAIIEGTNIGTWEWNVQTGDVIFNERWAAMLGYSLAELQPVTIETWQQLMHPDDLIPVTHQLEKHFSGELPFFDAEFRMQKKNGDWQWINSRGKVGSRDAHGLPLVMAGTHADISAIKNAYNRLQSSEDLLRSMLSNFPGAAYRRDNNDANTMHYLSSAVYQLTGYPSSQFTNGSHKITFSAITHAEDLNVHDEKVRLALAQKTSFFVEYRITHADGKLRWVQELGCGVFNEYGKLNYIDGFIWDVTDRHETERAKKVMDEKMASLYQLAPIGIMLHRFRDGKFLEANPEISRMVGYTEEKFKTMSYREITPDEYAGSDAQQIESLKTTGRYGPYEKYYIHSDGHLVPVLLNGVLLEGEDGEKQIWSIVQDVTEQKRVERMKSEFISTVSHELRTPLTSISGSLGLITNSMLGVVPAKIQNMLGIAYKNSQRLTLLINDLLDMEKLLAGKMDFHMQVQQLSPIAEQAVAENKSYADKYGVKFVIHDHAQDALINVDAFRLQQVLNNFLSNAAKYSPADREVDVLLECTDTMVRITVRDYGPGISAEFKDRIFQKFSQADSSDSRQKGGTGLG
ncbi:MAG: PAS domain S-box protein, partial [Moraxellaceae bacterium]